MIENGFNKIQFKISTYNNFIIKKKEIIKNMKIKKKKKKIYRLKEA